MFPFLLALGTLPNSHDSECIIECLLSVYYSSQFLQDPRMHVIRSHGLVHNQFHQVVLNFSLCRQWEGCCTPDHHLNFPEHERC